jgi:hypothetical protein
MKPLHRIHIPAILLALCWVGALSGFAQENAASIPAEKIAAFQNALATNMDGASPARKRLAVKRIVRDADELLDSNQATPNRFELLDVLFRARRDLLEWENSPENREAFLKTCKSLAEAPDEYAALRLDADLLLSQAELARRGVDAATRAKALKPLVERYLGTAVEAKALKAAMVMALELGDNRTVDSLHEMISERLAGDPEMIALLREKLGGTVIGAPLCGTFTRADGKILRFPMEGMGRATGLFFWSKENDGLKHLEALAAAWKARNDQLAGRLQIVSFNVDGLPDAGESILRGAGVDWPAMHLPGGRENPYCRAFARKDPALVALSPTGYAALVMAGTIDKASGAVLEDLDYPRWFSATLSKGWSAPRYMSQLTSLFSGEFLVVDAEGAFDPAMPPEWKANHASRLERTASSVPEETLKAIDACFIPPPLRYRTPYREVPADLGMEEAKALQLQWQQLRHEELRANYETAEDLCRKAIGQHPHAPDLWIARNRRIVALMSLWKLNADPEFLERAAAEAKSALAAKPPAGTDVVARFCLARASLCDAEADAKAVIGDFLTTFGGQARAPGPAVAAAALLALDAGERGLHEDFRNTILKDHTENPAMWTPVCFLLDRYHRYWLFRAPFSTGTSYGRHEGYFLAQAQPEECRRVFETEFKTMDGKPFQIPRDSAGKWTAILFCTAGKDATSPPHKELLAASKEMLAYAQKRTTGDLSVVAAFLDDDVRRIESLLEEKPIGCPAFIVPGGILNPAVARLGLLSEDERPNLVVLRPDGSISAILSGLAMWGRQRADILQNVIEWHDEKSVTDALDRGDIEEAKRLAFQFAPPELPEPEEGKNKPIIKSGASSIPHLRGRIRVYMALGQWDAALADAEEVVAKKTAKDASLSLRTDELDESEALRDEILKQTESKDP